MISTVNTVKSPMSRIILSLAFVLFTLAAGAQHAPKAGNYNLEKGGIALQGYDPVAYFTQNKAVEGSKSVSATVNGVLYYFSSAKNRDLFLANPAAYEPQYGGWCAYAMGATGEKVEIDPGTFKMLNGKLYLFYNKFFNNTLKSWNKDEHALKAKADKNWDIIIHKK
jgi:YHS domain-containing protein